MHGKTINLKFKAEASQCQQGLLGSLGSGPNRKKDPGRLDGLVGLGTPGNETQ